MNYVNMELWIFMAVLFTIARGIRKCPELHLPNGHVTMTSKGRLASFSCDKKYTLVGYSLAVCIGEHWSHPLPECLLVDNGTTTTISDSVASSVLLPKHNTNMSTLATRMPVSTVTIATTLKPSPMSNSTSVSTKNSKILITDTRTTKIKDGKTSNSITSLPVVTSTKPVKTEISQMVDNFVTMEATASYESKTITVLRNKTIRIFTHKLHKKSDKPSKNNNQIYTIIGISCVVLVSAVVIILIVCYKKWSKSNIETGDQMQLVSKDDLEEHEEWSLLTK